jgi:hypothetical protein
MTNYKYTFGLKESKNTSVKQKQMPNTDYRKAREQYRGTVHLFIGTTHSLYIITFIPFTMNYNNDIEYTQNIMGL